MAQSNCLVLADGTVFENSNCGFGDRYLWCWLNGKTMPECFAIFSDPEKIKEIRMAYQSEAFIYKGFTELLLIKRGVDVFGNETVDVRLTWPDGGEHSIEKVTKIETPEEEVVEE